MKNKYTIKEIEKIYGDFMDGWRAVLLLKRGKEGNGGGIIKQRIVTNREQFLKTVDKYSEMLKDDPTCRVYSCVNRRDPEKAIREFKRRQLEADYYDVRSRLEFYQNIESRFFSCFMSPSSRMETEFLIDIDEDDNEKIIKKKLEVGILLEYPTKNGKHLITPPFNPNDIPEARIKKDGLILLNWYV